MGESSPPFFDSEATMRSLLVCSILTIGLSWAQHSPAAEAHEPNQMDNANRALNAQQRAEREVLGLPPAAGAPDGAQPCETLDKLRAEAPKGTRFTTLNSGQFHFIAGVYVAIPPVSGMPPADAAVLVQLKKKNLIVWMKGTPSCASAEQPMQVGDAMIKLLRGINPGSGETYDADDSQDLHL